MARTASLAVVFSCLSSAVCAAEGASLTEERPGGAGAPPLLPGAAPPAADTGGAPISAPTASKKSVEGGGPCGDGGPSTDFWAAASRAINCLYMAAAREVYFCAISPRSLPLQPCWEKNTRARWLPPLARNTSSSSGVHLSMLADLTAVMCTPRLRWMPEQSRQMNTPNCLLVHLGLVVVQSKQCLLSFFNNSLLKSLSRSS
mmetsp:Transcript_9084/g.22744  ORF Transcript_9084/g.22744 Transcript_9084/m.22744 type:complete len:202 (-) Transcript_9084:161-766(-)